MSLNIEAQQRGQVTSIETWDDILFESAKEHARTLVDNGMADHVEIRDDDEKLLFHYPRMLRGA